MRPTTGGAMRPRIALVAACAAFILANATVIGVSEAVTSTTALSSHAVAPAAGTAAAARPLLGARRRSGHGGFLVSVQLVSHIERIVSRQRSAPAAPPPPPPPPAPAPPPPAPAPPPVVNAAVQGWNSDATSTTTADWACIRNHESNDNYSENTGNGYSGAYQFAPSTWNESVVGAGYPQYANGEAYQAPPGVQNAAALWLYNREGWSPWSTRAQCGL